MTDPIAEALDAFVPAFRSAEGDWQAILEAAAPSTRWPRSRVRRSWVPQRRRTRLLAVAAALVVTGSATAAVAVGLYAFDGIGAAEHPQSSADVLDPATAAYLKAHLDVQLDTVRRIGDLPNGRKVYVVTGPQNDLCTVVGPPEAFVQCGEPLSNGHPATITGDYAVENDTSTHWVVFGLAEDGVSSVTFQPTQADDRPAGAPVTVPVHHNLWVYQSSDTAEVDVFQPFTVDFADGTSVVEPPTGTGCAAC